MAVGEIIVHGAGGHSRVVTDVLLALGFAPAGFVEDEDARDGLPWLDSQIIGWSRFVAEHSRWACLPVALAVGDNAGRARAATRLKELGHHLPVLVHPSAVVSHSAVLGEGTVVMPLAAVNPGARIGAGVIVNTSAVIEHDCEIGDFAHLSPRSVLGGGARVESLAHLGLGAVLLPRASVGEQAVVGAGAVVLRHVPPGTVVAGVPARPLLRQHGPATPP